MHETENMGARTFVKYSRAEQTSGVNFLSLSLFFYYARLCMHLLKTLVRKPATKLRELNLGAKFHSSRERERSFVLFGLAARFPAVKVGTRKTFQFAAVVFENVCKRGTKTDGWKDAHSRRDRETSTPTLFSLLEGEERMTRSLSCHTVWLIGGFFPAIMQANH